MVVFVIVWWYYQADVNRVNFVNENGIFLACRNNNLEMVKLLMKHGGDPNIRRNHSATTMISAGLKGNIEMLECLLNRTNDQFKHSFDWVCILSCLI